jgi:hypothetical protein
MLMHYETYAVQGLSQNVTLRDWPCDPLQSVTRERTVNLMAIIPRKVYEIVQVKTGNHHTLHSSC